MPLHAKPPRRLREAVHETIARLGYSPETGKVYANWIKQFVQYIRPRHPRDVGAEQVEAFLCRIARQRELAGPSLNQARSALVFLYEQVYRVKLPKIDFVRSAKVGKKLPVVLSRDEVSRLLRQVDPKHRLAATLMYSSGLRLGDAIRIRTQDVDFDSARLHVRNGKGFKDRITLFPRSIHEAVKDQLRRVAHQTRRDRAAGDVFATMTGGLRRKFGIQSGRKWVWQYLFPSVKTCRDFAISPHLRFRHHIHESTVQDAVVLAGNRARMPKRFGTHVLRHSFATHMVQDGVDIHTVQKLLGHKDIRTTLIYIHLAEITSDRISSPIDRLFETHDFQSWFSADDKPRS